MYWFRLDLTAGSVLMVVSCLVNWVVRPFPPRWSCRQVAFTWGCGHSTSCLGVSGLCCILPAMRPGRLAAHPETDTICAGMQLGKTRSVSFCGSARKCRCLGVTRLALGVLDAVVGIMPVRLRSKKNSPKNPVLCYKDFTQRLNTKGKFGLCRILTHCSPKR